jgi:hypothetical protein
MGLQRNRITDWVHSSIRISLDIEVATTLFIDVLTAQKEGNNDKAFTLLLKAQRQALNEVQLHFLSPHII